MLFYSVLVPVCFHNALDVFFDVRFRHIRGYGVYRVFGRVFVGVGGGPFFVVSDFVSVC